MLGNRDYNRFHNITWKNSANGLKECLLQSFKTLKIPKKWAKTLGEYVTNVIHISQGTQIGNLILYRWLRSTVVTTGESTKPCFYSKLPLFKKMWHILRVLPYLSPLGLYLLHLRAFQWGTIWPYTSRGIKSTTSQSWNV